VRYIRALGIVTSLTLATTGLAAGSAAAAAPVIERVPIDDVFLDEFLTEECGVEVMTMAKGFLIERTFERDGAAPTTVFTINLTLTATAGENTYRFKDVGADTLRQRDGVVIAMINGQIPFDFTGHAVFDAETDELLNDPRDVSQQMLDEACAALTA
jgi:hypothetical protein